MAKRRRVYLIPFKLRVIEYAKTHTNRMTAKKYSISRKLVRSWKKNEEIYKGILSIKLCF